MDLNTTENIQWTLQSTSGKKLDFGNYSGLKLAPGVYFVHFNTGANQLQSKFIKL